MLLLVALSAAAALIGPISAQSQPLQSPLTSQQLQLLELVQNLQNQLAQQQKLLEAQQRQLQLVKPQLLLQSRVADDDSVAASPPQELGEPSPTPARPPQPEPQQQPPSRQRPSRPVKPRPQAQPLPQPQPRPNQTDSSKPQFLDPGVGRWLLSTDQACLPCICEAASGCDETLGCDERGFCGPFLLSKRYWDLAGRPLLRGDKPDRPGADADCLRDSFCAAEAVRGYLDRFAQDCDGDRRVDCFDLARVHFLGPFNCRAPLNSPSDFSDTFRKCWDASRRTRTR